MDGRTFCDYLHAPVAHEDVFKCVSCFDVWEDQSCVIKHVIKNKAVFFYLNCNDGVKEKEKVFDQVWKLMDDQVYFRQGI